MERWVCGVRGVGERKLRQRTGEGRGSAKVSSNATSQTRP